MAEHDLDAVISPSYAFGSSAPAVAGYPSHERAGRSGRNGKPAGIWMYAGFLDEPKLLAYAYDLEQELGVRAQPAFLNDVIPEPADAGLCPVPTKGANGLVVPTTDGVTLLAAGDVRGAASVGLRSVPQAIVIGRIARPTM